MKLFSTYNKFNLLATVLIFVLASAAYYFLLRFVLIDQLDESLKIEQEEIESFVQKYRQLPEVIPVKDQAIQFVTTSTSQKDSFATLVAYDKVEKDTVEFRQLSFTVKPDGSTWYLATVAKSMEGTENLIQSIIVITICTIVLILFASFIINRLLLKRLWQPFYETLQLLTDFKVGNKGAVKLPVSKIEEFSLMNNIVQEAISRADQDYLLLKEFTENASHEMQTPLAIIRSKLDLLIQEENLTPGQGENVQALYEAIDKLSKLNKSLLLLTKIENNQFNDVSTISLSDKLHEKLHQFQEIIAGKNITIVKHIKPVTILMNDDLADILLNNLISNSLKHNFYGGSIYVDLTGKRELTISNTSHGNELSKERLFTRFYKEGDPRESTGLGLSILKQICIVSGCTIKYDHTAEIHSFTVQW